MTDIFRFQSESADDSGATQKVSGQGAASEALSNIMRVGHFGFAYNAPVGSHGMAISPRGQADLAVLLGLEDPTSRATHAANLAPGQSKLYDAAGNVIFMAQAGGISISTASGDVVVTAAAGQKIHLNGPGGSPVMTQAGPSSVVFAN